MRPIRFSLTLLAVVGLFGPGLANEFPTPRLSEVEPTGVPGALVICGGGSLPQVAIDQFRELAGGAEARLVVIPTASQRTDADDVESLRTLWRDRGFAEVDVLHTRDREVANSEAFVAPLKSANAIWFTGGQQSLIAETYVGTRVESEIEALLSRGGVIGGTSAGAAIQSRLMIASGNPVARLARGLDLVPGAVIDQHFKVRNRSPRLVSVLESHPGYFGLGIDEGTALVIRGRAMRVVGESTVTVCFSGSEQRPPLSYELASDETADLTALRRAAIARASPPFPPEVAPRTEVPDGSLMIVGGGAMMPEMWEAFVTLAGGADANIVCIPTASETESREDNRDVRALRAAGAKSVTLLHTNDRREADRDAFVEPLRHATGVWFGGGRQWRLVDAYQGTRTESAIGDVLKRGGAIGGSSAGATIQGHYLVRGNPLGNQVMMAEGYERGFGFLPGAAIDQHFSQRRREADMEHLMRTFPQLLGVGIDESTAIVVQSTTARVIGANAVYFYDQRLDEDSSGPQVQKLTAGQVYDLSRRAKVD